MVTLMGGQIVEIADERKRGRDQDSRPHYYDEAAAFFY